MKRTKLILFVVIGIIAASAGVYYTLRYGSSRGDNATGMELQVIAAVLLGGVSIFGGRGALHGVIGGVLLIGVLASALRLANVTSDVINIITGVLLVLTVVSSSVLGWVQSKRSSQPQHEPLEPQRSNTTLRKESHEVQPQGPHTCGSGRGQRRIHHRRLRWWRRRRR